VVDLPPPGGSAGRAHPLLRSLALVAGLAVAGSAATGTYTVRLGDTLSEVAEQHGTSTSALASANAIGDVNSLQAGRVLTIPSSATSAPAVAAARSYTIRAGDTLSQIAAAHGVTTSALAAVNAVSDRHRVMAGRTLTIPDGAAAAPAPAAPAPSSRYTIAPGDTLSGLALRFGVTRAALVAANGLANPNQLVAGRALVVPPAGTPAAPAAVAVAAPRGLPLRLQQSPERLALVPVFQRWAAHYGVPADLLMAMTWLESGWQNHVVSPVGAVGIGQIMPDTTAWMSDVLIGEPLDPHDPDDNIRMSARYLRWLLDRNGGDARLALAGYYQGPASVTTSGLYPVTERYADNVLAFRDRHF
jgi:LysM repeat protein